jgi:hypothetical protein
MARSLNAQHNEKVGTNALLNVFLLIAISWLVIHAVTVLATDHADGASIAEVAP